MQDKKSVQLSPDDGRYVEGFATKLFMKADKQEIRGKANLNTAKTFYAASLFFEILQNFGDFPIDVEQKQKYAAWKAAEIQKALKKGRKPVGGPPASDKASPVSDGQVVNLESPSANGVASSQEQSFSSEQSPAIGLKIDAEQDQVSCPTRQSGENLSDPRFLRAVQSGGGISTSSHYEADLSDDDSFHSCSEGQDDNVLSPNDTCSSGLDQTISALMDVHGQVYRLAAKIAENSLHFSNRWFQVTVGTPSVDQCQHDLSSAAEIEEGDTILPNDTGSSSDHYTLLQDGIGRMLNNNAPLRKDIDSGLSRVTSAPTNVQGNHYEPSAAETVKALKLSKLAVRALALDDVPSAVSYLKQALDLLTIPPTNAII